MEGFNPQITVSVKGPQLKRTETFIAQQQKDLPRSLQSSPGAKPSGTVSASPVSSVTQIPLPPRHLR
jgi:hypothetical protein